MPATSRLLARPLAAAFLPALFLFALGPQAPTSGQASLGYFQGHEDVGQPAIAGKAVYDATAQTYTVTGSGTNMWDTRDEFHVVWRRMTGDFILRTQAAFVGKGTDPHRKLGWIVRRSLKPDSAYVDAAVHGDGLTSLQFRRTDAAATEEVKSAITGADVIQLERRGTTFVMSVARFGDLFTRSEVTDLDLGDEVFVGLFVCAHNPKVSEQAIFKNVRIVVPPKTGWTAYRDYIGSNLEVIDVKSGDRKVLYTYEGSFQAPNWTRDGRTLIYNQEGKLYRFDLATRTPTVLDTGAAIANNNDHVLSFDGKMLAISSADENRQSVVFTVPVTGGTPTRITPKAPSYMHGWSPDGKFLVYTGGRDGEFDIYRIPAQGGDEVNLTKSPGLDDGPEYTPDGQWIYFNSTRSGLMQIWRMRPDGSDQQQITNDEFNNWFPHISPDGKTMVIISYGQDVKPQDHPFYKHVYLRLMNLDGSNGRVLAYVFGGQGTINVPSWSPDGTQLAFVSNSALTAPH